MASEKVTCPKCGFEQYKRSAICKKCGLIFEKWKETKEKKEKEEKQAAKEQRKVEREARREAARPGLRPSQIAITVAVFVALVGAGVYWMGARQGPVGGAGGPPAPADAGKGPAQVGPKAAEGPKGPPGDWKIARSAAAVPPAVGAAGPDAPGAAGERAPGGPSPLAQAQAYDEYRTRLGIAVEALRGMEEKIQRGLTFEEMRIEMPRLMQQVAGAVPGAPAAHNSYAAIQRALDAYDMSLRLWEYRVYSSRYQGHLWCPRPECKYQSEKEFQDGVRTLVNRCWTVANGLRGQAEAFLGAGDARAREVDRGVREEITRRGDEVKRLWTELSTPRAASQG